MVQSKNKIIFKYRSFNSTSLEILINRKLWFADPDTFNDPFDCRLDYKAALQEAIGKLNIPCNQSAPTLFESIDKKIQTVRVCCFSQTKKNQLMWAHYADEHKGFCIGFNQSCLMEKAHTLHVSILSIDYKSINPYLGITKNFQILLDLGGEVDTKSLSDEFLKRAIATKYAGWKYEKEVRLVTTKIEFLDFSPKSINSITFGLRMPEKDKETLKRLFIGKEWEHVKLFETSRSEGRYALNFNLHNK